MPEFITICEESARAGGAVLLKWEGRLGVREKGPADLVTEADLASQEAIRRVVSKAFPDHAFVGEESPDVVRPPGEICWVVDPLDGTTNFVHGAHQYSVSVAVERNGEVLAGAVFDPVADECYTASLGEGVWLNGESLQTSQVEDLGDSLLGVSLPPKVKPDTREIADFVRIVENCQAIRRIGSAALNLAYVAAGRFDGYWAHTIFPWDVAAGVLMVREAGGVVTAIDGGPFELWKPAFVASSGQSLHDQLLSLIHA